MNSSNNTPDDPNADKSVAELEADIARTREQLGRDVEDASYKLSPDRFKEQMQDTLQNAQEAVMDSVNEMTENVLESTKKAGASFTDMIRRHPLPTALIGAGVALLAVGGGVGVKRAQDDDDYPEYSSRYGYGAAGSSGYVTPGAQPSAGSADSATQYGGASGYGATRNLDYGAYDSGYDTGSYSGSNDQSGAQDSDQSSGQNMGDRAGAAGTQAKRQAKAASRGLAEFVEEQPMIAGLITVVLGAVIGLSLPGTRQEDELLGEARDQFAEQARGVAERAKEVAQKTFDEAKTTAQQEFSKVQGDVKEAAKNVSESAKQEFGKVQSDAETAAKNVSENVKQTAKDETDKKSQS